MIILAAACSRVPGYVIQPHEMADLMADIRMANAVISYQSKLYPTQAEKVELRNAVLEKHGVTPEQFDTSLMWYGKNIGVYQDVTKETIEILEKRMKDVSAIAAGESAMSVAGDSVDIWEAPHYFVISDRSPSQYIAFDFDADPNWEDGDIYTLRTRFVAPARYAQWNLTAYYDDGAVETITSNITLDSPTRQELLLVTDSTRHATRLTGWFNFEPLPGRPVIADSISLTRRRSSPELARNKKFIQKLIAPKIDESNEPDSTVVDSASIDDRPKITPSPKNDGPFRRIKQQ